MSENELPSRIWERLSETPLLLDQTETPLEIDRTQIERFYYPLATKLITESGSASRLVVAVAGSPGCGKTAFATILVAVINARMEDNPAVMIGLDGWHYPNAYLNTHFIERGGKQVPLRTIKGAPETFDAAAAYDCLATIRQGGPVSFPVYSRSLHDPVPAGGTVDPSHRIVIVEGNYLLLGEEPWKRFHQLFDVRIFMNTSLEIRRASLIERHRRGGKTSDVIARQLSEVDLPNGMRVEPSAVHAHLLVHKADSRRIDHIDWLDGSLMPH